MSVMPSMTARRSLSQFQEAAGGVGLRKAVPHSSTLHCVSAIEGPHGEMMPCRSYPLGFTTHTECDRER
jgi:hypothetical protein